MLIKLLSPALPQIDKEGANPERAKTQLSEADLMPEEWGGTTPMVEVCICSASHPGCDLHASISSYRATCP